MHLETPLNAVIATIISHDLLDALYTSEEILLEPLNTRFSAAENRTAAALYMLYLFSFLTASGKSDELLKQWEFHDLLLHSCSRYGRNMGQFGATYRSRLVFSVSHGKLSRDAIGGGRSSVLLPEVSRKHIEEHVRLAHEHSIEFDYLMNATCINNSGY
jgi:hypothetical protein